ncbi:MAG: rhodanese-like domain-containing protein [Raineya sp.]|nr:rhodanese-like domain-containing protein [Raineya sp.]
MLNFLKNIFGGGNQENLAKAIAEGAFLVDVRTPSEFKSGSVKGAVNIPLDTLQANLSKFKGKNKIVVFCRSGSRSASAKAFLEKNGFQHVINGGSWQNVAQYVK